MQINSYDPTRTTVLRNQFASQMRRRFTGLAMDIKKAVAYLDVFGLKESDAILTQQPNIAPRAFDFPKTSDKIESFMDWVQQLESVENLTMEQAGASINDAWSNTYIRRAYEKGIQRSRNEMINAGYQIPGLQESGGVSTIFNTPVHLDRVGVLYIRTYNELKGVTSAMDQQISRVLARGLVEGKNPVDIGKMLKKTITGMGEDLGIRDTLGRYIPARRRAEIIARTEVIRAHHEATIQEYKNWAVEGVEVQAEWVTAGDSRVCRECADLEGSVYSIDEIWGMIPRHPQCRCIALPIRKEK